MADLDAGRPAPDFELPRDGGQTVRLSDFRGKIVVLFFYPKDDTTGCTAEAIDFTRHLPHFDSAGATVIGMSPDSVRRHERFKTKHNLGMPLVSDETHATLTSYGVWSKKNMFGRDYMGVVRTTFLIDRAGTNARIWRNVRVSGHAAEVLAAVRQM
jgi:thioredoxin-dependent peroxiredoxin